MSAVAAVRRWLTPVSDRLGPIGIDFALEAVHLVQLSFGSDKPTVQARASVPYRSDRAAFLADSEEFLGTMRSALDADHFLGGRAVLAAPSSMFRTLSINYRTPPGVDDAEAIVSNVRDRIEGELADHVIDYLPVKSRSKKDEKLALVAVSEQARVISLLENARRSGLTVDALEIGPVAIARLVGNMDTHRTASNVLVINSGRQCSYLTLISDDDLLFDQQVDFGENELVRQLSETLDMPEPMARGLLERSGLADRSVDAFSDDALGTLSEIVKPLFARLAREVKRVCLYAAAETRGGSVSQVYLLGGIARWPGSDRVLESMTNVKVTKIPNPLDPFTDPGTSTASTEAAPQLAVATGLALRTEAAGA